MLCIYHIADHDGKGSAAIVKSVYPEIELMGLNHDMEIPFEEIEKHDKIVVCDISLPVDFMFKLSKEKDFVWIDHHVSVIEQYENVLKNENLEPIKGIRRVGTAAMILTWEYFYPDKDLPLGIKLLGLNDIFDLKDYYLSGDDIFYFTIFNPKITIFDNYKFIDELFTLRTYTILHSPDIESLILDAIIWPFLFGELVSFFLQVFPQVSRFDSYNNLYIF